MGVVLSLVGSHYSTWSQVASPLTVSEDLLYSTQAKETRAPLPTRGKVPH